MTGDLVIEDGVMWIDLGPAALIVGDPATVTWPGATEITRDGETIGLGWEGQARFEEVRPVDGYEFVQVERTGSRMRRALDHIFHTPFGERWLYEVRPVEAQP